MTFFPNDFARNFFTRKRLPECNYTRKMYLKLRFRAYGFRQICVFGHMASGKIFRVKSFGRNGQKSFRAGGFGRTGGNDQQYLFAIHRWDLKHLNQRQTKKKKEEKKTKFLRL